MVKNEDGILMPVRSGTISNDYGTYCHWAVYDRKDAEEEVGWVADTGNTEFAENLTGWSSFHRGAGRAFGDEPVLKVFGRKILVYWRTGLDI